MPPPVLPPFPRHARIALASGGVIGLVGLLAWARDSPALAPPLGVSLGLMADPAELAELGLGIVATTIAAHVARRALGLPAPPWGPGATLRSECSGTHGRPWKAVSYGQGAVRTEKRLQ